MPDAPDFAVRWPGPSLKSEDLPALWCDDGELLLRPSTRDLAEKLGLQTNPRGAEYDTVILGGGPAGLAAAVYGASEGLRTLVIEREAPGGQAETSSRIEKRSVALEGCRSLTAKTRRQSSSPTTRAL